MFHCKNDQFWAFVLNLCFFPYSKCNLLYQVLKSSWKLLVWFTCTSNILILTFLLSVYYYKSMISYQPPLDHCALNSDSLPDNLLKWIKFGAILFLNSWFSSFSNICSYWQPRITLIFFNQNFVFNLSNFFLNIMFS